MAGAMRIGIDFDNTIANYDGLLADLAVEEGFVAACPQGGKRFIRDAVRRGDGGEIAWQKLQALAFGPRIGGAVMMEGLNAFLAQCQRLDVAVFVVSHKTRFAAQDRDGIDLHAATLGWMEGNGFFSAGGVGMSRDQVYFEPTRGEKVARIAALGCTHFVDDLEDVFGDSGFPDDAEAILFAPNGPATRPCPWVVCDHWDRIAEHLFAFVR